MLNATNLDTLSSAEQSFAEACRRITSEQHATLTSEIVTLLLQPETNHAYRVATIRMASLVLRFAPEGQYGTNGSLGHTLIWEWIK
jgi:hypothetical protein